MIMSLILTSLAPIATGPAPASNCAYDLNAMLELDLNAFDQDLDGGWRPLSYKGCKAEAAELIREWRNEKRIHASILYWHEGQMRASAGQTKQAVALFKLTYKPASEDSDFGWNHYVQGTIAFLRQDKAELELAIKNLKAIPTPTDPSWFNEDGTPIFRSWPPNLRVLEAFKKCWNESYNTAYSNPKCHEASDD
jgi:hypothetical protein